ncbi:phosphoribosylamine--glycine ligase [Actinopolymorpha alba]|uniref:phosphoribosylamine--glycine ligase n=1 Tax=Actinopolymorpha alba TaxID=533267 RepID=UPI0003619928|nr:phosphoribosylamine--glycine ligase [Actinopolymorpha alba]
MDVLVVGSGGREHALALALGADPAVQTVHVAPGNPGAAHVAETHPLDISDNDAIADLADKLGVDLVIVGPEAPLVNGAADAVRARGIACFGPSRAAAWIEGSKAFAKEIMAAAGVPTAMARVCENADEVAAALDAFGPPYVVKDDGLASGKGVVVTTDRDAALAHAASADRVVVEEYLDGPEVSLFGVTDGKTVVPLMPAQDFKRVGDGDAGPNTGGMGAYAPLPWAPPDLVDDVVARVLQPTVDELRRRGTPFAGLLYAGLALTSRGVRVVEFNCRFGDPETQVLLPLLRSPLGRLLHAAATGTLADLEQLRWQPGAAVTVVVATHGYPEAPRTGDVIEGAEEVDALEGVHVIHAGTSVDQAGNLVAAGGRVLAVTAHGPDLAIARDRVYDAVARIHLEGAHHRMDIAAAAVLGEVNLPRS